MTSCLFVHNTCTSCLLSQNTSRHTSHVYLYRTHHDIHTRHVYLYRTLQDTRHVYLCRTHQHNPCLFVQNTTHVFLYRTHCLLVQNMSAYNPCIFVQNTSTHKTCLFVWNTLFICTEHIMFICIEHMFIYTEHTMFICKEHIINHIHLFRRYSCIRVR